MSSQSERGRLIFATILSTSLSVIFIVATAGSASAAGLTTTPSPTSSQASNSSATPTPSASTYAQQLEAYKAARDAYQVALAKWKVDFAVWQSGNRAAIDANNAAFQLALDQFKAAQKVREAKRATIDATFTAAVGSANSESKIAMSSAKTADQKLAIRKTLENAKTAALDARKTALDALGPELLRPTKTALVAGTPAPVKPVEPTKPLEPIKPKKPEVSPSNPKPTKSENSKKLSISPLPTQKENIKS